MAQYVNKVVYGGQTLIDLTSDSVTSDKMLSGITAHDKSGAPITGTCTFDADTSDANAVTTEILKDKTAYVNGKKIVGSMPNIGGQNSTINTKEQQIQISQGYHDGSGRVGIDTVEQNKIIPANIKGGISILGVVGEYTGSENVRAVIAEVTPLTTAQQILPTDFGNEYNYISQVNVAPIDYVETENSAGGKTVTIGKTSLAS